LPSHVRDPRARTVLLPFTVTKSVTNEEISKRLLLATQTTEIGNAVRESCGAAAGI
jgi:hypothetical protein